MNEQTDHLFDSLDTYRSFEVFQKQPEEKQRQIYELLVKNDVQKIHNERIETETAFELHKEQDKLAQEQKKLKILEDKIKQEKKEITRVKLEAITGLSCCEIEDMSYKDLEKFALIKLKKPSFWSRLKFWKKS